MDGLDFLQVFGLTDDFDDYAWDDSLRDHEEPVVYRIKLRSSDESEVRLFLDEMNRIFREEEVRMLEMHRLERQTYGARQVHGQVS